MERKFSNMDKRFDEVVQGNQNLLAQVANVVKAGQQAVKEPEPVGLPDPVDDPEGYRAVIVEQAKTEMRQENQGIQQAEAQKANVLSRGLLGDVNGEPVVASPLFKQHFNLKTGACLEEEGVTVNAYAVRLVEDRVEVKV